MPGPLRSGFITVLGRPNAGKSTLVNRLVGEKVAIVTPHPQTTRTHLLGVANLPATVRRPAAQLVLVDTPGVHRGRARLHRELLRSVRAGLEARDLSLLVVDSTRRFGPEDDLALAMLRPEPDAPAPPAVLALNKIDRLADKRALLPLIAAWQARFPFAAAVPVSALNGDGADPLLDELVVRLPAGPAYFPAGQFSDQPEWFALAELIREQAMLLTRQEVPHALAVSIESDTRAADGRRVIAAALVCERAGQKAILVGKAGAMVREIGTLARRALESRLREKIHLTLQVLVREEWRERESMLKQLDYHNK